LKKVVVLVTLSTEKFSLLFLDFSTIFNRFYKMLTKLQNREESFYAGDPRTFKTFTQIPSVPPPSGPTAMASSLAVRWSTTGKQATGIIDLAHQ
jgi:hypothetical protein